MVESVQTQESVVDHPQARLAFPDPWILADSDIVASSSSHSLGRVDGELVGRDPVEAEARIQHILRRNPSPDNIRLAERCRKFISDACYCGAPIHGSPFENLFVRMTRNYLHANQEAQPEAGTFIVSPSMEAKMIRAAGTRRSRYSAVLKDAVPDVRRSIRRIIGSYLAPPVGDLDNAMRDLYYIQAGSAKETVLYILNWFDSIEDTGEMDHYELNRFMSQVFRSLQPSCDGEPVRQLKLNSSGSCLF